MRNNFTVHNNDYPADAKCKCGVPIGGCQCDGLCTSPETCDCDVDYIDTEVVTGTTTVPRIVQLVDPEIYHTFSFTTIIDDGSDREPIAATPTRHTIGTVLEAIGATLFGCGILLIMLLVMPIYYVLYRPRGSFWSALCDLVGSVRDLLYRAWRP